MRVPVILSQKYKTLIVCTYQSAVADEVYGVVVVVNTVAVVISEVITVIFTDILTVVSMDVSFHVCIVTEIEDEGEIGLLFSSSDVCHGWG